MTPPPTTASGAPASLSISSSFRRFRSSVSTCTESDRLPTRSLSIIHLVSLPRGLSLRGSYICPVPHWNCNWKFVGLPTQAPIRYSDVRLSCSLKFYALQCSLDCDTNPNVHWHSDTPTYLSYLTHPRLSYQRAHYDRLTNCCYSR